MRRDLDADFINSFRKSTNCTGPRMDMCITPLAGDANTCVCKARQCSPFRNQTLQAHIEVRAKPFRA
jgi:hypothetical protein